MKKILSFLLAAALIAAAVVITLRVERKKTASLEAQYVTQLEAEQAKTDELSAEIQAFEAGRLARTQMLTERFTSFDYADETVYVIGHTSPDADTVCSAIGMAYLLDTLGIPAEARTAGQINLETEYGLDAVGCAAPEILEDAAGKQLWLVDHASATQMVSGAEDARIVGITDHHGTGDVDTSELINVLSSPVGSTSSLVVMLCAECGVELPQDVSGALMVGVLSDTANMKSKTVTKVDEAAFARLKELTGIADTDALFNGMLEAKLSYRGMDDREIFYSDYKLYETDGVSYGIGNVKVAFPEQVPEMAERMLSVIRSETENGSETDFLLFEVYDSDYALGYMGFCGKDAAFTEQMMTSVFGETGQKQGEFYSFSPSLSRKSDIVPPIDAWLDALPD